MTRMNMVKILSFLILSVISIATRAQDRKAVEIKGTWEGQLICNVKDSSCVSSTVVCQVSKEEGQNAYVLVVRRKSDARQEPLLTVHLLYDQPFQMAMSADPAKWSWQFYVNPKDMHGYLGKGKIRMQTLELKRVD
jgi:hypothetical protein